MERVGIIVLYPVGENVPADEEREYALMTIREAKLDLSKLFEAAERARKEIATWPLWEQIYVKWWDKKGWKQ